VPDANPNGERALVTGASGFIGSALVERLKRSNLELHALSRAHQAEQQEEVHWWRGDVADPVAVANVFAAVRPDIVINLAGDTHAARDLQLVRTTFDANLAGTVNVLTAAADVGCRRVVLTGSLEEPAGDLPAVASSPYAASKWASSVYGDMFGEVFGVPIVTLRVFMAYGPGQRDVAKLIPYTILSLLRNEAPRLSSGMREVDWIYIDDVADAYAAAAFAEGVDGAALDIGSGELHSVREVVERLTQLVAPTIAPQFGAVGDRPSEQIRVADTKASSEQLGWHPATKLDDGLARTVEWYTRLRAGGGECGSS
jgi:nucleoside-diphosphate-sugar epimerase